MSSTTLGETLDNIVPPMSHDEFCSRLNAIPHQTYEQTNNLGDNYQLHIFPEASHLHLITSKVGCGVIKTVATTDAPIARLEKNRFLKLIKYVKLDKIIEECKSSFNGLIRVEHDFRLPINIDQIASIVDADESEDVRLAMEPMNDWERIIRAVKRLMGDNSHSLNVFFLQKKPEEIIALIRDSTAN